VTTAVTVAIESRTDGEFTCASSCGGSRRRGATAAKRSCSGPRRCLIPPEASLCAEKAHVGAHYDGAEPGTTIGYLAR
jgi:hypothetical protein